MGKERGNRQKHAPPTEWIRKFSRSKPGKSYFYNTRTKETTWKLPDGVVLEALPSDKKIPYKRKADIGSIDPKKRKHDVPTCEVLSKVTSNGGEKKNSVPARRKPVPSSPAEVVSKSTSAIETQRWRPLGAPSQVLNDNSDQKKSSSSCPSFEIPKRARVLQEVKEERSKKKPLLRNPFCNSSREISDTQTATSETTNTNDVSLKKVPVSAPNAVKDVRGNQTKTHSNHKSNFVGKSPQEALQRSQSCRVESKMVSAQSRLLNLQRKLKQKNTKTTDLKPAVVEHLKANVNPHLLGNFTTSTASADKGVTGILQEPANTSLKPLKELQDHRISLPSFNEQLKVSREIVVSSEFFPQPANSRVQDHLCRVPVPVGPAAKRLSALQSKLQCETQLNSTDQVILKSGLSNLMNNNGDCFEPMDFELESEVLSDIGEFRQSGVGYTNQNTFMDVDFESATLQCDHKSALHIVLDTNILLSHLEFVKTLRDRLIPGKGLCCLYLPWQVIHELDCLKDRGKPKIQTLARKAINFLQENLSSKHPRFKGQSFLGATENPSVCPDDNILRASLELKHQGYDVILLSNDTNLRNKALVSDLQALSREQLMNKLQEAFMSDSTPTSSKSEFNSLGSGVLECRNKKIVENFRDMIMCEVKDIIRTALSEVVSKGMEEEYSTLWKKRTLIAPPWEADQVLKCLLHHWSPISGDCFVPSSTRQTIENLLNFLKSKTKGFGLSAEEIKEGLELTRAVFSLLPKKFEVIALNTLEKLKNVEQKIGGNNGVIAVADTLPINSLDKNNLVLESFQEALIAAGSLSNPDSLLDPTWIKRAESMMLAVQSVINLLQLLLLKPIDLLNEQDLVVSELANLIKGDRCITAKDIVNFSKQEHNRQLMENGIAQFSFIEKQLSNLAQSLKS